MPVSYSVKIPANKVVYLGHLNTQIVSRSGGELHAGPLIPLLEQALAGASTGTFKIKIEDQYDEGVNFVKQTFPIFEPIDIVNMSPSTAN